MSDSVVVTGAAGFVGAHVVRALVHGGRRVVATDVAPSLPAAVLRGLDVDGATYVAGDLRDAATREALVRAGGDRADVVHVAAILRFAEMARVLGEGAPTPQEALEVFEVNARGTWELCTAFTSAGTLGRFVYISTRSVYGGLQTERPTILESDPQTPLGIYGSSKAAAEVGVLALKEAFGLDLAIARITGVFGPWQTATAFIANAVEAVTAGEAYRTPAGGDDQYEFTYAKDTARGILAVLQAPQLQHAIYHISSGSMHSLHEVGDAFRKADASAVVEFGPGGAGGRVRKPLDGSRAATEFGFRPEWDLHDAIADYLQVQRTGDYGPEVVGPTGR
jgi:nucleoside-diphosphate-sugar epimerase